MSLSTFMCPNCGHQDLWTEGANCFQCHQCKLRWIIENVARKLTVEPETPQAIFDAAADKFDVHHAELLRELKAVQP
jgi:hypothetical protein